MVNKIIIWLLKNTKPVWLKPIFSFFKTDNSKRYNFLLTLVIRRDNNPYPGKIHSE
jgi:hypothetical protein